MACHRRTVLKGLGASTLVLAAPFIARAQTPMRIGFSHVKTGPLASGGAANGTGPHDLPERAQQRAGGRLVQLFTGDSAGAPRSARTKMQELSSATTSRA